MHSKLVSHPLAAVTWFSDRRGYAVPNVPWRFALALLGLGVALVIVAVVCPEFFVRGFSQFGPDTP